MPVDLSIVVPLLNEEDNIFELYDRLRSTLEKMAVSYELILVDDGSRDRTLEAIERIAADDPSVKFISFSRNFGHQPALFAGLEKSSGESVVMIDGDLQDPPEIIEKLYHKLQQGNDIVYAKRDERKGEAWLKKTTAAIFYRIMKRITSVPIPIDTGDFSLFRRKVADELLRMQDHRKFLRGQIAWLGFKESQIHYTRDSRKKGKSNFTYAAMFRFAFDGITGFSNFPLKFASISGLIVSAISFLLIIYVLLAKLVWGATISGWSSIMVTVLFLGGIQLLSVGIIGEYISRINEAVRNRQLYVVKKTNLP